MADKNPNRIISKITAKDIQNVDGSWDYKNELEARDAFERGVISQGQLDDFVLARNERIGDFLPKLQEFYSPEEIQKMSDQDFDLIKDFFGRFNNPKRKVE